MTRSAYLALFGIAFGALAFALGAATGRKGVALAGAVVVLVAAGTAAFARRDVAV